ncbi:protein kinase family protein [Cellulomonas sp. URHD0024]|uniref:protein kinase family protein n=1 Tax=Cellulomonas sp. URHD0024 TaxID=1302620 RepID=UPI00054E1791|nr:protein kinase family protein [Cellulomonas sp. URHD0024]
MSEVVGRGTVLAGRYRVLSSVDSDLQGASAWQATDQILDRPVRVRVLESGAVAPALDAARRAALVADPRLVRVLDVGSHDGYGYVVSEQLVGPSLAELASRAPLTAEQARAVIGEAAAALEVARRRGVHHLALRPSVVHVSPDGRVLVGGLALDAALLGDVGGDARSTTRADAVGLVRLLYAALTGHWPGDPGSLLPTGGGTLPPAPVVDGAPVPPAQLVPTVPNDLDTLCAVTLGPNDDGPHSPGELVRELEPWGEIRASGLAEGVAAAAVPQFPPTGDAAPEVGPSAAAVAAAAVAPVVVQRQSVRSAFRVQEEQPPGANLPGTPPPAIPAKGSTLSGPPPSAEASAAAAAAAAAAAVPPATAPPVPRAGSTAYPPASVAPAGAAPTVSRRPVAQATAAADFDEVMGAATRDIPIVARRFDPTALVLTIVVIAVIVGVIIAIKILFSGFDPRSPSSDDKSTPSSSASAPASTPGAVAPATPAAPAAGGPPVIASATTIDPSDTDGEHQEDVAKAYDGDATTWWYTQTYKSADFAGFKPAVGYAITLTTKTTVNTVTLHSNSTGGQVEIRATDAAHPTDGPVLASGAFGAEVTFGLVPPPDTQSLVLWITQLPTTADGSFRLELAEISLS